MQTQPNIETLGEEPKCSNLYQLIPRIAVVDSDAAGLSRVTSSLENQSFEVRGFRTGQQFLDFLADDTVVDLALVDIHLQDISGWNLARQLRTPAFSDLINLPIILKSAVFSSELATPMTKRMGGDAFLAAPFTASELSDVISTLLQGQTCQTQRKHLIISKNPRSHLRATLRRAGFQAALVSDPDGARLRLRTYRPDIVLVEESMAGTFSENDIREASATFILLGRLDSTNSQLHWLSKGYSGIVEGPGEPGMMLSLIGDYHRADSLLRTQARSAALEQRFQASSETFQLLFDGIPDPALIFGPRGEILDVNENCQRAFSCEREHLVGRLVSNYLTGEQLNGNHFENGQANEESVQTLCTRFNGTTFDAEVQTKPLLYKGRPSVIAFIRDTTAEETAREAVRVSEAKLKIIAENTQDWEFWRSPHGHFLYSSPACEKICGYHPREFEMMPDFLQSIALPTDYALLPEQEEAQRPDERLETEFRLVNRAGQIRWVRYSSHPVYDDFGNLLGRRGNIRDVTDQRKVARERETLGAAVEQSTEAIGISNMEGAIEYANPAFRALFEWTNQVRLRKPLTKRRWDKAYQALEKGESWSGKVKRKLKTGKHLNLEFALSPLRDGLGKVRQIIWVVRDITAQTEMRERLETAQRMDSLGNLAGGLAHDFNNLLAGILGHASLLATVSGDDGEVSQAAEVISKAARRASDLTQKLLGFARRGKQKHEPFCLHAALNETEALLGRNLPKGAILEKSFEAETPWLEGDPSQLSQVLINLTINGVHALGEKGGRVGFETYNSVCPETGVTKVHLNISDNGCGMNHATVQRIFEPFFTTKDTGSGLGLAMVYGIVTNHGGELTVDTEVGKGTTFCLSFPTTELRPSNTKAEANGALESSRGGRILVIDDENMVRLTLTKLLEKLGYEVVACASALEGLEYYGQHQQEVGLVILDMLMPGMDGLECFQRLKQLDEGVRVILSTGYCHNDTAKEVMSQGILQVLPKPFDFRQVATTIQQHLLASN